MEEADRKIVIIAGPNGAGKTTFARGFLAQDAACDTFVNADLIAAGIAPFRPAVAGLRAGRLMLKEIRTHVRHQRSFAFETTLSGRGYSRMIPRWRDAGYTVKLVFLSLKRPEEAIRRVNARVKQGGHDVPPGIICRRFARGWQNFQTVYRPIVDCWQWMDNGGSYPVLVDEGGNC